MTGTYGRGRPYPARSMLRARELGDAGWSPQKIRDLMVREGLETPAWETIKRWINQDYEQEVRAASSAARQARMAKRANFKLAGATAHGASEAYREEFVALLAGAGLVDGDVAKVCAIVLGGERPRPRPSRRLRRNWGAAKAERLKAMGLELRRRGVPYAAISVVFDLYEDAEMTPEALRRWLTMNGAERNPNKARARTREQTAGRP